MQIKNANCMTYPSKKEGSIMDFETKKPLTEVLCKVCRWKLSGECNGNISCETFQYVESKI